jgi:hypothetical protein
MVYKRKRGAGKASRKENKKKEKRDNNRSCILVVHYSKKGKISSPPDL